MQLALSEVIYVKRKHPLIMGYAGTRRVVEGVDRVGSKGYKGGLGTVPDGLTL